MQGQRCQQRMAWPRNTAEHLKRTFVGIAGHTEDIIVVAAGTRRCSNQQQQQRGGEQRQQHPVSLPRPACRFPPLHVTRRPRAARLRRCKQQGGSRPDSNSSEQERSIPRWSEAVAARGGRASHRQRAGRPIDEDERGPQRQRLFRMRAIKRQAARSTPVGQWKTSVSTLTDRHSHDWSSVP